MAWYVYREQDGSYRQLGGIQAVSRWYAVIIPSPISLNARSPFAGARW
jgi:hypothetical protein